ncbi:MAG: prenyltransferase/squalene oxidase repeat-containing protein [Planctomycetota bacterium]
MTIDPSKYHVESHTVPIWQEEQSFQEIMAEQLRHAPWLLLSIVIHGIAVVLLLLIQTEAPVNTDNVLKMQQEKPPEEIEEEEPPPEEVEEEEPEEEPVLQDVEIEETLTEETFEDFTDTSESAFDNDSWNTAVGLGGGAGGKFGGRGGGRRGLGASGGRDTARAIELGLEWLAKHQDEDGRWDADDFMKHDLEGDPCDGPGDAGHDVGVTGLALLAFLGDGSTMKAGPYKKNIRDGVRWLREQQQETGLFGTDAVHAYIYDHAIAAYAMVEAYQGESKLLKKYAQRGIDYLESHRNPDMVWRYEPQGNDNDTSITGWCVMAYKSAQDFNLKVNDQAIGYCEVWFDQVTDPASGRAGYRKRGEPSSREEGDHEVNFPRDKGEALTAVGLMCRFFLGQDPDDQPTMVAAADTLLKTPPIWDEDDGSVDHYYWYYGSYALYQMGKFKGKDYWGKWAKSLTKAVVKTQRDEGNFKGSWDPIGVWGEYGGRVYSTAILVLTLEAYYRYTRLIR